MTHTHTHTHGPWTADIYCVWAGEIFICGTQTGLPVERQIANARLIASAPELLAALECILKRYDSAGVQCYPEAMREVIAARAAIARATIARATTGGNAS